jgi:hypothetical protein
MVKLWLLLHLQSVLLLHHWQLAAAADSVNVCGAKATDSQQQQQVGDS